MQITMKRLGILALAICLLAALMFGWHSVARAANWWPDNHTNSLTVYATGDEGMQKDLADARAYVLLFKVASANAQDNYEAFDYEYVSPFGDGELKPPTVDDPKAKEIWQERAKDAAKKVCEGDYHYDGTEGRGDLWENGYKAEMHDLADGIYLAVMYSENNDSWDWNDDYSTTITGARAEYTFMPQLIALPSKAPVDGQIASSNPDPWVSNPIIYLKPEQSPFGDLVINKNVKNFEGKPATFEFHIVSTDDSPIAYENYASIYYTGGASATTIVRHIPAGTKVKVIESYEGGRFHLTGTSPEDGTVTIVAGKAETLKDNAASVTFTNEPNGNNVEGHGIQNSFTYSETSGDWEQVATPGEADKS